MRHFFPITSNARSGRSGVVRRLTIDAAVQPEGATTELALDLARIAPFGAGNPSRDLSSAVGSYRESGCGWRKPCSLLLERRGLADVSKRFHFKPRANRTVTRFVKANGLPLHVAGHIRVDRWQGREEAQLIIEDVASVS